MASNVVWIAGSYQSDFSRNLLREGLEVSDLVAEILEGTLEDAQLDAGAVQSIHVGNAFGQLFNGQGQLGAMPATIDGRFWGLPAARHEAACASGSVAVLAAMAEIEAGRYDCVLVLGIEQERNVPGVDAPRHLGAAAWVGHEGSDAKFMWPYMFSQIGDEYERRYGLNDEHLHAIAELNTRNARSNPLAQTRDWKFSDASFSDSDTENPIVEGRLRRTDCSQVTDGGAGVLLVSDRFRGAMNSSRGAARILGWAHATAGHALEQKLVRSRDETHVFPHVRKVASEAIDHFGITGPGESWKAIENGDLERDGSIPINPSGGLIGVGHPVGATGVRMLHDAARQVTGRAQACQVEGATRFATLNIGGSLTTTVSFVVGGAED